LERVERIVSGTESVGEETITLLTADLRSLLDLAKRAPKAKRGPHFVSGALEVQRALVVNLARGRRDKLVEEEGMGKGAARERAAKEWAAHPLGKGVRMSATEIEDRMQRKP
jgi:hypothetical protein